MVVGLFTDSYKPYICGVTTSVEMLKQGLEALGHEVYVICTKLTKKQAKTYQDTDPHVIRINGIHLHKKGLDDFRLSMFAHIKYRKLRKYKFDIVHIHTEFTMRHLGLVYARKMKVPAIYTSHTMYEDYFHFLSPFLAKHAHRPLMWFLKKFINSISKKVEYTIAPSHKLKEKLENYNLKATYKVIPTGIEIDRFFPKNVDLNTSKIIRQNLGIADSDFCFLYLGRCSKEKSIDILVRQFLNLECENVKMVVVGTGVAIPQLKQQALEHPNGNRVIFTGVVPWEDVPKYYQIADCFLNASITETQGLTYIEGLASGLPVIYRKDSVLDEVIIDKENGILYETEEELLHWMKEIMINEELRNKLSNNASKSVEKYSKECYTNNVLELYNSVLKTKEE